MAINTETNNMLRTDLTRQLLLQREMSEGALRESIEASWLRSFEAGIDTTDQVETDSVSPGSVKALHEHNRLLLDCAAPEIEMLVSQYAPQKALIMLADARATLLTVDGENRTLDSAFNHALIPGICWSEESRGTNALGTALVDNSATRIEGSEHFLNRLNHFSCTSAPIRDTQGRAVGVLDLTSQRGKVYQPLEVVQLAARAIENRLFSASFADHAVIAIHRREQYLNSVWQGLIALECDGSVLGANEQAHQLLGSREGALRGKALEEVLGVSASDLLSHLMRGKRYTLQARSGVFHCSLLQLPKPRLSVPLRAEPQVARPQPQQRPGIDEVARGLPRLGRSLKMALKGIAHDLPVLILGETGSGKEVVARALHDAGCRADKPFVAVNCAAIPEGLIESELFGYREGAFTGSRRGGMVGRFQQADGGTLFLDEIGDMPLALQARLLRVLQERRVAPLGGGEEVDLNIRLICATHRDMRALVAEGSFREDLFYRLNGVGVKLPALRERGDLAGFINTLLQRLQPKDKAVTIETGLLERLTEYHWPGNIRQIETVLKAALAFLDTDECEISEDHLTDDFLEQLDQVGTATGGGILRFNEMDAIRKTLEAHQGNITATAKALGISRATLYRRLQAEECGE